MPFVRPEGRTAAHRSAGIVLGVALLAALIPSPASAQSPKPAKKDSSPRTKPKDVVLTPSVVPAEARPGDTVVYTVTAKLGNGWHIYTYAKEQADQGPRKTRFDLFDAGGLTVASDWTASREPLRKKEDVFPDVDAVEFFEGEVSWSLSLKVPEDAAPGKATVRCQASYQICNAKSCSFPGAWTLPEATLTVIGPEGQGRRRAVQAEARDVLKRRSNRASAKPGDTVTYSVTATLEPGWHIYDYAKDAPAGGPAGDAVRRVRHVRD